MCAERRTVEMTQEKINMLYSACQWLERLGAGDPDVLQQFRTNSHFAYAISYNQDEAEGYFRKFNKYLQSDKEFDAYDAERMKLIEEKHGKRDSKGELIVVNGVFVMKDQVAFNADIEELRKKHPAYQIREDKMEEVFELELHVVPFRHVPAWLPPGVMRAMRVFIDYEVPDELVCPDCGAELCMKDGELCSLVEPVAEPVAKQEPKEVDIPRRQRTKPLRQDVRPGRK
jgi:hypothetical protein